VFVDVEDDARTIGARLRQIRHFRKKSLRVVAALAGISKSKLSEWDRLVALGCRTDDDRRGMLSRAFGGTTLLR
jgi:transcriptional regulator with XRE-family HTH domain